MGLAFNGLKSSTRIAYYCSGHGYGHATRVSAFACALLSSSKNLTVHIVSSAPQHVFSDSIACGALYRYAEIDPVIVQPLAYRVDRRKSVAALKSFLAKKEALLQCECAWLREIEATAVLSDAAFLGCLASKAAGIPSALITNFSFDSVYSYLSTPIVDKPEDLHLDGFGTLVRDEPIPLEELEPLVAEVLSGYRCADLLILLPGYIPIPSFFEYPSLPASQWVDCETKYLHPNIAKALARESSDAPLLPAMPFPNPPSRIIPRRVITAPLLVRAPNPDCYTLEGRIRILGQLGIPEDRRCHSTKVLVVSFGGQHFHSPSRSGSGSQSRNSGSNEDYFNRRPHPTLDSTPSTRRLTTESHIWVPGAPPAYKGTGTSPVHTPKGIITPTLSQMQVQIPSVGYFESSGQKLWHDSEPCLLPDPSWIAIVCGVSKEQWLHEGGELPEGFYVAPKDIYMPDLIAVADVLLGKLGYGTVSECVDACTPFVYVSRPLFVEEHGLRLLLERDGVGVGLSRTSYEAGEWAAAINKAASEGKPMKDKKRSGGTGDAANRKNRIEELAKDVTSWISDCSQIMRAD